jgi:N-acetyl-alpha-D-muramate 1-phosphate uridylyltransferase
MLRHAMILAAGRGERMRPLTDHCPKPLLQAGARSLIDWHLQSLAGAGFEQVVINHAHLGHMIEAAIGERAYGMQIHYSAEPVALETAGGIRQALGLLGNDYFSVINGDVFCDFSMTRLHSICRQMLTQALEAWCVVVDNPPHHQAGDFGLRHGRLMLHMPDALTFSGIGVYHRSFFSHLPVGQPAKLAPLLFAAIEHHALGGQYHDGYWLDVGTPERLAELNLHLSHKDS